MMMWRFLLLVPLQWLAVSSSSSQLEDPPIALDGCKDECGDVKIPYPFGIGPNYCFHDAAYEIVCNPSIHPPKPFLKKYNLQVTDINWDGKYSLRDPRSSLESAREQTITLLFPAVNVCTSDGASTSTPLVKSIDFNGSPYLFSSSYNVLIAEGCGGSVMLKNRRGDILSGCASVCPNATDAAKTKVAADCYGVGCCQAIIEAEEDIEFYQLVVHREGTCNLAAALIDSRSVDKFTGTISNLSTMFFPAVLEWSTTYISDKYVGMKTASCDSGSCWCNFNCEGNPFLPQGCQVVRECRKCRHHCGDRYNGSATSFYCVNPLLQKGPILGFSIGMGSVLLLLGCYWLYRVVKRRREVKRKAKYFKRNGGLLLQQQMSSSEGLFDKTKIFRTTELEKATNKFNKNRILGQGGQGTVYKGILTDGKIVAIKKSKQVDESQLEQFINEVVILSQINHRNVVKLLGCCLETEVPLLVYEFILNGTLYQHLHEPSEDFHITWKMRLQIAAESADALVYLHSSSSTPIYHRDIKSSNILLDEKYRAKVSDFGASRAITIEQTHVTTCVLGTYGYLDPEYFQSNQFTEKSDVYSFGVVLVELITGKKPIRPTEAGGWISLACDFLFHMETSHLFDILDKRILDEGKKEEFIAVAELAKRCLNMSGKQRPTMKEIAVLLDGIRSPNLPNSKEPHYGESKSIVTEISQSYNAHFRTNMFFSDVGHGTSGSLEVEPLMANTL